MERYTTFKFALALMLILSISFAHADTLIINAEEKTGYSDGWINASFDMDTTDLTFTTGLDNSLDPIYGFVDFDLSSLPAGATITSISLNLTMVDDNTPPGVLNMTMYSLPDTASNIMATPADLYSACGGTGSDLLLLENTSTNGAGYGEEITIPLGSAGQASAQTNSASDFFSICIFYKDIFSYTRRYNSSESGAKPKLIIEYTTNTIWCYNSTSGDIYDCSAQPLPTIYTTDYFTLNTTGLYNAGTLIDATPTTYINGYTGNYDYHIDSTNPNDISIYLKLYYVVRPTAISHYNHAGQLIDVIPYWEYTWTESGSGGYATFLATDIDTGVGSNMFYALFNGSSGWAYDGEYAGIFDGSTSYLDAGTNVLNTTGSNFTFAMWVSPAQNTGSNFQAVGGKSAFGVAGEWDFYVRYGRFYFQMRNATTAYAINSDGYTIGNWYLILATYDANGTFKYYRDGTLIGTSKTTNFIDANYPLRIGARSYSSPAYFFNGSISSVQLWNKTLSQAEINSLYSNGHIYSPCNVISTGQVLCVDFDDLSINDKSSRHLPILNVGVMFGLMNPHYITLTSGVDYTIVGGLLTLLTKYTYSPISLTWQTINTAYTTSGTSITDSINIFTRLFSLIKTLISAIMFAGILYLVIKWKDIIGKINP